VRGVKMRWVGAGLITSLHFVKILELFHSMLVDGADGFGEVAVHLLVADVEVYVVVVDDPGEDWVLGQVVVGTVGDDVDEVQVLDVCDLAVGPHAHNIPELNLHDLLTLLLQMPIHHLPSRLLTKDKQQRIRVIIEPNLNPDLLEQESIPSDELYLPVSELNYLVVGAVYQGVELYLVF